MINEEKILNMLEKMDGQFDILVHRLDCLETGQERLESHQEKLIAGQVKLEARQASIEAGHGRLESDLDVFKEAVVRIESSISALFDGNKQLNDKLDRIERQVSSQDEAILKRVFPMAMDK